MPPNQAMPPADGQNPYDFIFQSPAKPKRSLLPNGASRKQRIIVVGGGLAALLLFFLIFFIWLFSNGGSNLQPLVSITQTQNEIIRVSGNGSQKLRSTAILDFTETTHASTLSAQQKTIAYLAAQGEKVDSKRLAQGQNASTDEALKTAEQAGTYDKALYDTLYKQLTAYQAQVADAYAKASGSQQKELLQQLYNNVTTLLKNQPVTN